VNVVMFCVQINPAYSGQPMACPTSPDRNQRYSISMGMLGLHYRFADIGWHFVVTHNMRLNEPKSYISKFSEEQMKWLTSDLAANKGKPTMLIGHYPPVSAVDFFNGRASHIDGACSLSTPRMSRNLWDLVRATGCVNVKAFFSGHIHRIDRVEAAGQAFVCTCTVSGRKWPGHDHETPEGSTDIDYHEDGTFDYRYHDHGQEAM